ncbi:polyprenyl synthetase family protein [Sporolactobacillus shoreicorticis]|uniref:Polyprenyl synthetase family protein n=1 Tax=Sporolactobacillus shoreicorticis TaxID=1923877 RepID=A0ABW5S4E9_9BACL|nr:polyprenyl synthetase family protein [Sporolactobacillus shoreicorticis]MCO7125874.1 polyprenyl synthetase family protein [Sporolactobacillus shoreicorticis]
MGIHRMWESYPELKEELADVLKLIESYIRVRDTAIQDKILAMIHSGGKMLRPAYSLLCAHIGPESERARPKAVAAALECLHMATLVHDDVIDKADTRHGQTTVHVDYGNKIAVYTGDYLLALAFSILSKYADSAPQINVRGFHADKILAGELAQLHGQFHTSVSVKRYFSQISGKTAQLFAVSCYAGALAGKADQKDAAQAWRIGYHIGMAFQIIDDLLDYQGSRQTLGKPVMSDIRQGIYTLPLIYAVKADPDSLRPYLNKDKKLDEVDIQVILTMIKQHDGIAKSMLIAEKFTQKALNELRQLPDGRYKITLERLTKSLLARKM